MYFKASWFKLSITAAFVVAFGYASGAAELPSTRDRYLERARFFGTVPWKTQIELGDAAIGIAPIHALDWQGEKFRFEIDNFTVAYVSIQAVCWPDMKVCPTEDRIFCDIKSHGVPGYSRGKPVLLSRWATSEKCVSKAEFSPGHTMHDTIEYRWGIRWKPPHE